MYDVSLNIYEWLTWGEEIRGKNDTRQAQQRGCLSGVRGVRTAEESTHIVE